MAGFYIISTVQFNQASILATDSEKARSWHFQT